MNMKHVSHGYSRRSARQRRDPGGPRQSVRSRSGLTLLELIVVIVVLGLLVGLVAPQILGRVDDARTTAARTQMSLMGTALDNYRLDNGSYPASEQGLASLRERPSAGAQPMNWRGPYLRKEVPLDPWDRPYVYVSPGERNPGSYDLLTFGRDGKPGGTGLDADIIGQ